MKTQPIAIVLMISCGLTAAAAQVLLKVAAPQLSLSFDLVLNYVLWGGVLLYVAAAILMILAMKKGEVSVIYPLVSLSFVWVFLSSVLFLNESFTIEKTLGIFAILIGVSLLGVGSK